MVHFMSAPYITQPGSRRVKTNLDLNGALGTIKGTYTEGTALVVDGKAPLTVSASQPEVNVFFC